MTKGGTGGVTGQEENDDFEPIPGGENEGSGNSESDDDSVLWPDNTTGGSSTGSTGGSSTGSTGGSSTGSTGGSGFSTPDYDIPDVSVSRRGVIGVIGTVLAGVAADYLNVVPGDKNAGAGYGRIGDCGGDIDGFGFGEQESCSSEIEEFDSYDVEFEDEDAVEALRWFASVEEDNPAEYRTDVDISQLGEDYLSEMDGRSDYVLAMSEVDDGGIIRLLEDGQVEKQREVDSRSYQTLKSSAEEYLEINS